MWRPIRFGLMMGLVYVNPWSLALWLVQVHVDAKGLVLNQIQVHVEQACLVLKLGFRCRFGLGCKPTTNQH
jgi:hypothetical protein